jgi:hypothetical protein
VCFRKSEFRGAGKPPALALNACVRAGLGQHKTGSGAGETPSGRGRSNARQARFLAAVRFLVPSPLPYRKVALWVDQIAVDQQPAQLFGCRGRQFSDACRSYQSARVRNPGVKPDSRQEAPPWGSGRRIAAPGLPHAERMGSGEGAPLPRLASTATSAASSSGVGLPRTTRSKGVSLTAGCFRASSAATTRVCCAAAGGPGSPGYGCPKAR